MTQTNKKINLILAALALAIGLSACASDGNRIGMAGPGPSSDDDDNGGGGSGDGDTGGGLVSSVSSGTVETAGGLIATTGNVLLGAGTPLTALGGAMSSDGISAVPVVGNTLAGVIEQADGGVSGATDGLTSLSGLANVGIDGETVLGDQGSSAIVNADLTTQGTLGGELTVTAPNSATAPVNTLVADVPGAIPTVSGTTLPTTTPLVVTTPPLTVPEVPALPGSITVPLN